MYARIAGVSPLQRRARSASPSRPVSIVELRHGVPVTPAVVRGPAGSRPVAKSTPAVINATRPAAIPISIADRRRAPDGKMSRRRSDACSASSGGAAGAPSTPVTLNRRNSPSSPFSRWTPCSANVMPAPDTISRTDAGTSTSPGPRDRHHARRRVHHEPARLASGRLELAEAHPGADLDPELADGLGGGDRAADRVGRTLERGEEPVARRVDLVAAEPAELRRTIRWCRATSSTQRVLPISAAIAVEPTMSVNSTAARPRPPVRRCIAGVYAPPHSAERPSVPGTARRAS